MKNLIIAFILLLTLLGKGIFAQKCVLEGSGVNSYTKISPPSIYKDRQALSKTSSANFDVDIVNSPGAEADNAVMEAINIWSYLLNNFTQTIKIKITWKDLENDGPLAQAGPTSYEKNFSGQAETDKYYPIALAEAIAQQNLNGDNYDIDVEISTNSSFDWYYGLDGNTPANKYDLLSVTLHEIEHGLGFIGTFKYSEEIGSYNYNGYPMIYDGLIASEDIPASALLLSFPNNSKDLGDELTSNSVYITGNNLVALNNGNNARIYAPTTWSNSSITHFDEDTYPAGNGNSLMSAQIGMAESIHSPGELGLAVMQDIGWSINRVITITNPAAQVYLTMGNTYDIIWTDNFGGTIQIELWKRNLSTYYLYRTIESNYSSNKGSNTYSWNVPLDLQEGEYKLKMLDAGSGYGMSETFNVQSQQTETKTVYFDQRDESSNLLGRIDIWPDDASAWEDKSPSSNDNLVLNSQFAIRAPQTFPDGTTKNSIECMMKVLVMTCHI